MRNSQQGKRSALLEALAVLPEPLELVSVEDHGDGYGNVELKRGKVGYFVAFTGVHGAPSVMKGKTWGTFMSGLEDGPERDEVLAKAWELLNSGAGVQLELALK